MGIYTWLPEIFNMSLTAGVTILVILFARLFLGRAPKVFCYVLWIVVLFRLLCPVTISSSLSLLGIFAGTTTETGSMEYIPADMVYVNDGTDAWTADGNGTSEAGGEDAALSRSTAQTTVASGANQVKLPVLVGTWVWFCGMAVMLIYSGVSLYRLKKKLVGAVCIRNRVYESDYVTSPFVLGILRPGIYLPSDLGEQERDYILLHERTHIRRGDHMVKLLFFLALVIHWFNPLVWLAFRLMEKDMEMSCDEAVMRHMDGDIRAEYALSLLRLATGKNAIAGVPLAFGEGDTKARIKNVMRYHKPAVFGVVLAVAAVLALMLALGSNPGGDDGAAEHTEAAADGGVADTEVPEEVSEAGEQAETAAQEAERLSEDSAQYQLAERWAKAFCGRDGEAIVSMSTEALQDALREEELLVTGDGYSGFGWSSPWPWDDEEDYTIVSVTENSAEILFYAWVSDPHVTVWREELTFQTVDGELRIDAAELEFMDAICTGYEYGRAYPNGITGTRMDYQANGTGQALNEHALVSSDLRAYEMLYDPERAAVYLLNLLDNENKVEVTAGSAAEDGSVPVTIHFVEDDGYVTVYMIQLWEDLGIWIPQTAGSSATEMETVFGEALDGVYELSLRSISESGVADYVADELNGGPDGSLLPFAEDCVFAVNTSMSGVAYEEVSYDVFADYIVQGADAMNRPCVVTLAAGEVTELCLKSAYYRYGICYNAQVSDTDEYKEQQDIAGTDLLEVYYSLDYRWTAVNLADGGSAEHIEVYTGNIGDGDSGYVFVKDGGGSILYNEFAHTSRAGWKNIYLGENKDGAFLMTVHIEDRDDYGEYSYQVFRLGEEGDVRVIAGSDFAFGGSYVYDDDLFGEWVAELEEYLGESVLLLGTQDGEVRTEHVSDADRYNYETLGLKERM